MVAKKSNKDKKGVINDPLCQPTATAGSVLRLASESRGGRKDRQPV